jgi:putative transcriptional regulator
MHQIRCLNTTFRSNTSELMQFDKLLTDAAVLAELGHRLERHRLERNWTQAELAAEAGIGQATVQRAERGESVQMTSMIKLLRALDLLAGFDLAVPESIDLPIAQLEREQRKARQRARGTRGGRDVRTGHDSRGSRGGPPGESATERWRWGNEPGSSA